MDFERSVVGQFSLELRRSRTSVCQVCDIDTSPEEVEIGVWRGLKFRSALGLAILSPSLLPNSAHPLPSSTHLLPNATHLPLACLIA